jgi:hypothetical protein
MYPLMPMITTQPNGYRHKGIELLRNDPWHSVLLTVEACFVRSWEAALYRRLNNQKKNTQHNDSMATRVTFVISTASLLISISSIVTVITPNVGMLSATVPN